MSLAESLDLAPTVFSSKELAASGSPSSTAAINSVPVPQTGTRWIILPVCIPGNYSSNVIAALTRLFGFARVLPPADRADSNLFESTVISMLDETPVVIADRSNHLARHRASFQGELRERRITHELVALNWDISCLSVSEICSLCLNGQTSRESVAKATILRYIEEYESLQPDEFEHCVDLDPLDDLPTALVRAAAGICIAMKIELPDSLRVLGTVGLGSVPRGDILSTVNAFLPAKRLDRHRVIVRPTAAGTNLTGVSGQRVAYANVGLCAGHEEISAVLEATALVESMRRCPVIRARALTIEPAHHVTAWETVKAAFYDLPLRLPTLARAMWTLPVLPTNETPNDASRLHRVALRGYDKIVGINETPWSTWHSLAHYLTGPFHVTAKLNGTLIMVIALTPMQLLVTSRHSPSVQALPIDGLWGPSVRHADVGESWLRKQLAQAGKTADALAAWLWKSGWTLMCELLDDDYEERVMPVTPAKPGLYLHGINVHSTAFTSKNPRFVADFAATWGFIPTPYETCATIDEVELLVNKHTNSDTWHDVHVEGLVIRATVGEAVKDVPTEPAILPYPPPHVTGASFFFKVYFQRYTFYHSIRMITKTALSGQVITAAHPLIGILIERSELKAFELWITARIAERSILLDTSKRRGFVSVRTRFLDWLHTEEGQAARGLAVREVLELRALVAESRTPLTRVEYGPAYKWLVLFLGLPGCGKTSIAGALSTLFGFKHVEYGARGTRSSKMAKTRFLDEISPPFKSNRIVLADGPCHRTLRRENLFAATSPAYPEPRVLVFDWRTTTANAAMAHRIALLRLMQHARKTPSCVFDGILGRFEAEYEALDDGEADIVVPMRYDEDLAASIERAVHAIATRLGIRAPGQLAVSDAIRAIRATGKAPRTVLQAPSPEAFAVRHYAFVPELDVPALLQHVISTCSSPALASVWRGTLELSPSSTGLIYTQPRMTLVHPKINVLPQSELDSLSLRCASLSADILFRFTLRTVVFNRRIMVAVVDHLICPAAVGFVSAIPQQLVDGLHFVIARCQTSVSPQEASALLQNFRHGGSSVGSVEFSTGQEFLARLQGFITL